MSSINLKSFLSQIFQKCFSKQKKMWVHMISNTFEIHMNFVQTLTKWIYLSWLHLRPGNLIVEKLFEKHGPRKRVMERVVSKFLILSNLHQSKLSWKKLWNSWKTLKYLFFIGNDGKPDNHRKLDKEFEEYGDIVEEDFQENYYNLTLKTIGQLKWATHYCPNMKYGLHIDDDVFGQA